MASGRVEVASGSPSYKPKPQVVAAGEVNAGNLQVTTVQIALVQRDGAVYGYLLEAATAHGIVGAFNDRAGVIVHEAHGAVFGVVDYPPNACSCLYHCLIATGIRRPLHPAGVVCSNPATLIKQKPRTLSGTGLLL